MGALRLGGAFRDGVRRGRGFLVVDTRSLTFATLTDGQVIVTATIDIDVEAVDFSDGVEITLFNSGDGNAVTARLEDGRVIFTGYELPPGEIVLTASIDGQPCTEANDDACVDVTLTVNVPRCSFVSPLDGATIPEAGTAAPEGLEPFTSDVTVDCGGLEEDDFVSLSAAGVLAATLPSSAADDQGRITFEDVALPEGGVSLAVSPGVDAQGLTPRVAGVVETIAVTVETGRCMVSISPASRSALLASNDKDGNPQNGLQVDIELLTNCDAASDVRLFVDDPNDADGFVDVMAAATGPTSQSGQNLFTFADVTLPNSASAAFDVQVVGEAQNADERGASVASTYWVDVSVPDISLLSTSNGVCVSAAQDQSMLEGLQAFASGVVAGAENGSAVWITVEGSAAPPSCETDTECGVLVPAGCETDANCAVPSCLESVCRFVGEVQSNVFVLDGITLPAGESPVTLRALSQDLAGNRGEEASITVDVFPDLPTVSLSAPADGAALGITDDTDAGQAGLQFEVQVLTDNVPPGSTGTLEISGQAPLAFTPAAGMGATNTIDTTLLDGVRTLNVRIDDPCGSPSLGDTATVTVVSEPSDLRVSIYERQNDGFVSRVLIPDGGTTNDLQAVIDVFTGTGTATRNVTVSQFSGTTNVDGELLCDVTSSLYDTFANTVAAAQSGLVLGDQSPFVSLRPGTNCFSVTVDDGVNILTDAYVVEQKDTVPFPTITVPSAGTLTDDSDGNAANGFNTNITVSLTAGDSIDGTMFVDVGDLSTLSVPVMAGEAEATLTDASLPQGTFDLTPRYEDALGNMRSGLSITVTVDSVAGTEPQIALMFPNDGQSLPSATLLAQVELLGGDEPATCTLSLTPTGGGAPVTVGPEAWPAAATDFTFSTAPVVTDGTFDVQASCNQASGTGLSQVVTVTIDDTAPLDATFVDEPEGAAGRIFFTLDGSFINGDVPDGSALAGLQHDVSIQVPTGGEDATGSVVTLSVTAGRSHGNDFPDHPF